MKSILENKPVIAVFLAVLLVTNVTTWAITRSGGFSPPSSLRNTPDNAVKAYEAMGNALTEYSGKVNAEELEDYATTEWIEILGQRKFPAMTIDKVDEQSASRAEVYVQFEDGKARSRYTMAGSDGKWKVAQVANKCSCQDKAQGVCWFCKGVVECNFCEGQGRDYSGKICVICDGKGKCNYCKGTGKCPDCPGDGWQAPEKAK